MRRLLRIFLEILDNHDTADKRGMRLLRSNLTPAQLLQNDCHRYFDVIGGETGRRYRIHHGDALNVDEFDEAGRLVSRWCFLPKGNLVRGDVLLAQKLALELFESEALLVANKYPRG